MSKVRVHSFSVSLDGFATGEGISSEAPFGHAGTRRHEWMFATQFGAPMLGRFGGTVGVDNAFAEQHAPGIGAEIMGRGKFGPRCPLRSPGRRSPRVIGRDRSIRTAATRWLPCAR